MVDHAKLLICTGMLLLLLGVGCAGTGSQHSSVSNYKNQADSMPSRKRMLIIAKTYEDQGHDQRAITAYRQVAKRYPKTEQARFAQDRIIALNGSSEEKKTSETLEETMLADSTARADSSSVVEQDEAEQVVAEKAQLEQEQTELPFSELPLPDQLVEVTESKSEAPADEKAVPDSTGSQVAENDEAEDAKWPEWSDNKVASKKPEVEPADKPSEYPSIYPVAETAQKKEYKEEILSPPAAPMIASAASDEDEKNEQQAAEQKNEIPIFVAVPEDLSWKDSRKKTETKQEGWVASSKETEPVTEAITQAEPVAESEPAIESELSVEQQEQVNHRLASLAYLIGNEESVTDDALDSLELLLEHEDQHVRINSAEALFRHQRGSEKALQAITSAFTSTDESIRFIALHALVSAYRQAPEETIQVMMDQLEADSPSVQRQVVLLLGEFRGHSGTLVPRLQQLVDNHPDQEVREAALLSLVCLKE